MTEIDHSLLTALEAQVGIDRALGTSQAGALSLACFSEESSTGVALADFEVGGDLVVRSRHEDFVAALRAMGPIIDSVWDNIAVDELGAPHPTVVLPCQLSLVVYFRCADGVHCVENMTDGSGRQILNDRTWPSFTAALDDEADDSEMRG